VVEATKINYSPQARGGVRREKVIEAYVELGSIVRVSKALGLAPAKVARILRDECGPIYGLKGVCRLYLLMRGRCLLTAVEARRLLRKTKQDVYYLFRELAERVPAFRATLVALGGAKLLVLYRDAESCREELARFAPELGAGGERR